MESNEQINKQNRNRFIDTENRLTGLGVLWDWVKNVKGLSKQRNKNLIDANKSMVITRGKSGAGRRG